MIQNLKEEVKFQTYLKVSCLTLTHYVAIKMTFNV